MWLGAFIWVLAHKEKDADITSKTKSQPKQKGFRGFLLISHISTKLKKNQYNFCDFRDFRETKKVIVIVIIENLRLEIRD